MKKVIFVPDVNGFWTMRNDDGMCTRGYFRWEEN